MLISSLSVSAAVFSDVKQGDWYYETVSTMSAMGLFEGKGNNMFCPDDTMTRAEFLTVTVRAIFSDTDITAKEGQQWWQPVYLVAVSKGLITQNEYTYSSEVLNDPIPRQEMALILTRACKQRGEWQTSNVSTDRIADYNTVDDYYKEAVLVAFTKGLIAGKDNKGTFDPHATLTRAEGATVLYRLVNKSKRVEVGISTGGGGVTTPVSSAITITEGAERTNRLAREGDTVIKADGSSVVLKKGPNGVLGEGQGVAPDLGLRYCPEGDNPSTVADGKMFTGGSIGRWTNSLGQTVVGDFYYVHPLTGEGHWGKEWSVIYNASYDKMLEAGIEGKYDGEISPDKQLVWDADGGEWMPVYNSKNLK